MTQTFRGPTDFEKWNLLWSRKLEMMVVTTCITNTYNTSCLDSRGCPHWQWEVLSSVEALRVYGVISLYVSSSPTMSVWAYLIIDITVHV